MGLYGLHIIGATATTSLTGFPVVPARMVNSWLFMKPAESSSDEDITVGEEKSSSALLLWAKISKDNIATLVFHKSIGDMMRARM